jgi:hypothetical protein
MMYNDKIGYGPTVSDALTGLFGPGAGATAAGIAPTEPGAPANPPPRAAPPADGSPPPPAAAAVPPSPSGAVTLSPAKAAALKDVETALGAARDAQKSGDFAAYGAALQRLDDAISKFDDTK